MVCSPVYYGLKMRVDSFGKTMKRTAAAKSVLPMCC